MSLLSMSACPQLSQEFLQMAPWEKPAQTHRKKVSKDKKREMPQDDASSPSPWPVPSDLDLDQRTDENTRWSVCVRACARVCVRIERDRRREGEREKSHWRHPGSHTEAHTFFTHTSQCLHEKNVKMWIWALDLQVAWAIERAARCRVMRKI